MFEHDRRLLVGLSIAGVLLALICTAAVFGQDTADVPEIAKQEAERRGSHVEQLGHGYGDSEQDAIAEAMAPPADDSGKWFISVVEKPGCEHCRRLVTDFKSADALQAFVDVEDHNKSWAHFNVYRSDDPTQSWRWQSIKVTGYPTLLIQPPRNGAYGDPATVVRQITGYDGNAKRLATDIRNSIAKYASTAKRFDSLVKGNESAGRNYTPPFDVPARQVENLPFDLPPSPVMADPASLILTLVGGLLTGGNLTTYVLLGVGAFWVIREWRKKTGKPLYVDDATAKAILDLVKPKTEKPAV
jgi:hypothetical protein